MPIVSLGQNQTTSNDVVFTSTASPGFRQEVMDRLQTRNGNVWWNRRFPYPEESFESGVFDDLSSIVPMWLIDIYNETHGQHDGIIETTSRPELGGCTYGVVEDGLYRLYELIRHIDEGTHLILGIRNGYGIIDPTYSDEAISSFSGRMANGGLLTETCDELGLNAFVYIGSGMVPESCTGSIRVQEDSGIMSRPVPIIMEIIRACYNLDIKALVVACTTPGRSVFDGRFERGNASDTEAYRIMTDVGQEWMEENHFVAISDAGSGRDMATLAQAGRCHEFVDKLVTYGVGSGHNGGNTVMSLFGAMPGVYNVGDVKFVTDAVTRSSFAEVSIGTNRVPSSYRQICDGHMTMSHAITYNRDDSITEEELRSIIIDEIEASKSDTSPAERLARHIRTYYKGETKFSKYAERCNGMFSKVYRTMRKRKRDNTYEIGEINREISNLQDQIQQHQLRLMTLATENAGIAAPETKLTIRKAMQKAVPGLKRCGAHTVRSRDNWASFMMTPMVFERSFGDVKKFLMTKSWSIQLSIGKHGYVYNNIGELPYDFMPDTSVIKDDIRDSLADLEFASAVSKTRSLVWSHMNSIIENRTMIDLEAEIENGDILEINEETYMSLL